MNNGYFKNIFFFFGGGVPGGWAWHNLEIKKNLFEDFPKDNSTLLDTPDPSFHNFR